MAISRGGGGGFFTGLIAGSEAADAQRKARADAQKEEALEYDRAFGRHMSAKAERRQAADFFRDEMTKVREQIPTMQPHQVPAVFEQLRGLKRAGESMGLELDRDLDPNAFATKYGLAGVARPDLDETAAAAASALDASPSAAQKPLRQMRRLVGDYQKASVAEQTAAPFQRQGFGSPEAQLAALKTGETLRTTQAEIDYGTAIPQAFRSTIEQTTGAPWSALATDKVRWSAMAGETMMNMAKQTGLDLSVIQDKIAPFLAMAEAMQSGATEAQARMDANETVRNTRLREVSSHLLRWVGVIGDPGMALNELTEMMDESQARAYRTLFARATALVGAQKDVVETMQQLVAEYRNANIFSSVDVETLDFPGIAQLPEDFHVLFDMAAKNGMIPPGMSYAYDTENDLIVAGVWAGGRLDDVRTWSREELARAAAPPAAKKAGPPEKQKAPPKRKGQDSTYSWPPMLKGSFSGGS